MGMRLWSQGGDVLNFSYLYTFPCTNVLCLIMKPINLFLLVKVLYQGNGCCWCFMQCILYTLDGSNMSSRSITMKLWNPYSAISSLEMLKYVNFVERQHCLKMHYCCWIYFLLRKTNFIIALSDVLCTTDLVENCLHRLNGLCYIDSLLPDYNLSLMLVIGDLWHKAKSWQIEQSQWWIVTDGK